MTRQAIEAQITQPVPLQVVEKTLTLQDTAKPYVIADTLKVAGNGGTRQIKIAPGVEVRGGEIALDRTGELILEGKPDRPVVLRNVTISQDLNNNGLRAKHAVFDQCKFKKGGGWFSYFSSKWVADACLFYKCEFASLKGSDYGFKLTHCAFVQMRFPEITHKRKKDEVFDHMTSLRSEWNTITDCQFVECTIPPTVGWCSDASNFIGCSFASGEAFESNSPTLVNAFVAQTAGEPPHHVWQSKRSELKIAYASKPFPAYGATAGCPIPEISGNAPLGSALASRFTPGSASFAGQTCITEATRTVTRRTTTRVSSEAVAQVADAELQKSAKSFLKNQSSIKGLYVTRVSAGQTLGSAQEIIATVELGQPGYETTWKFATTVGSSTRISLDEAAHLVKVRYPVWKAGHHIRFSFSEKYSMQSGGSAGGALTVLLMSLFDGFQIDPAYAMTGDVTVDGKIREIGGLTEKVRGAVLEKCTIVALPLANKENLSDMVLLYSPAMLWSAQLFSIATLDEAVAVARQDRSANLAKAIALFASVQPKLGPNAGVPALRNLAVYQTLRDVLRLAPNHLSAEFMLRAANYQLPNTLSLGASLEEIWAAGGPVMFNFFLETAPITKKNEMIQPKPVPADTVKAIQDRLAWLDPKLHPKTRDLKAAMADYAGSFDDLRKQATPSAAATENHQAKRDKLLAEVNKIGTDRKLLEERMHGHN